MPDEQIKELMREAPLSFVGTVEHLGAATMSDIPVDERTAVIRVDHVLHAPEALARLEGQRVSLQLTAGTDPPAVGESAAFFTKGLAFGESIALTEIGRLPVAEVEPRVTAATQAGHARPLLDLESELAAERLGEHAAAADAVVVGTVTSLAKVAGHRVAEHDPDWWKATIAVEHAERGDVKGDVEVLYANSRDVRWQTSPKPRASQHGLWVLHATEGDLKEEAPFQILHKEDFQPVQSLDALRTNGG
ncbi:MAG TPA: hypothetical protein VGI87_03005 [Solirubrobacteraceae bacterium]|jgi:hypothetical protein